MERREAAEYLGVSLSTLDRMASQGRLTRGRARRKTRPVTVYDRSELTRLREELQQGRIAEAATPPSVSRRPDGVGFRLDSHYAERLRDEAGKRGVSPGEHARTLVIRALEDDREEGFRRELSALRSNLAEVFYLLMVTKLGASEADARQVLHSLLGGD